MSGLKEECGVVGIFNMESAAYLCKTGLYMLQHRGQEAAGIISFDEKFHQFKNHGLVSNVFDENNLAKLTGNMAIGHVRYATSGDGAFENIQPFLFYNQNINFALCHNGNIVNSDELKAYLSNEGVIFQSNSDSEILGHLITRNYNGNFIESLKTSLNMLQGAFSFLIIYNNEIYCCRDKNFMRPLAVGKTNTGYVVASETCVFAPLGAEYVCDVQGGEIIILGDEIKSHKYATETTNRMCAMEYVYFSRPDTVLDGHNVSDVRNALGRQLYKDYKNEIEGFKPDMVVAVPDSSLPCAVGFSQISGISHELPLVKHKYSGRSFIEPTQAKRTDAVNLKLGIISSIVRGKNVILIDDSVVRGTTSKQVIKLFKQAGAKSVMFLVASPKLIDRCYYGVDIHTKDELIAHTTTHEKMVEYIGCDYLGFLSIESLKLCLQNENICTGCFNSKYPTYIKKGD